MIWADGLQLWNYVRELVRLTALIAATNDVQPPLGRNGPTDMLDRRSALCLSQREPEFSSQRQLLSGTIRPYIHLVRLRRHFPMPQTPLELAVLHTLARSLCGRPAVHAWLGRIELASSIYRVVFLAP